MKFSYNQIHIIFAATVLLLLPIKQVPASVYGANTTNFPQSLTQNHEDIRQFELSASQARSKVEHTLVNFLLGQTVDQYLDFGDDDVASRKNFRRLKLRLNNHRAIFIYQYNFY